MNKSLPILIALTCTLSLFSCRSNPTGPSTTGIPTEGLLAYYPFNGSTIDKSGNRHDGTANGGITWVADRSGHPSSACHLNGTDAYISIADSANDLNFNTGSQSYTISCWVSLDSLIGNRDMEIIMDRGTQAIMPTSFDLFYRGTLGRFVANAWDDSTNIIVPSVTMPATNQWYHLVMVADQKRIGLYVNGTRELFSSDPFSSPDSIPYNFKSTRNNEKVRTIGDFFPTSVNGHHYFAGSIDDIRIYNRALTGDEIQSLYHEGGR